MYEATTMTPKKELPPSESSASLSVQTFSSTRGRQVYRNNNSNYHNNYNNRVRDSINENNKNVTKNPKSPSSTVCVSCFFELFSRTKMKKSEINKKKSGTTAKKFNNKNDDLSTMSIENCPMSFDNNDNSYNDNTSQDPPSQQYLEVPNSFSSKLSPTRRKKVKDDSQSQQQQQQSTMRRSRLTLTINNNHFRSSNYPNIEYVYCTDYNTATSTNDDNNNNNNNESSLTAGAAGEVVHTSTPRYDRVAEMGEKTGKVIEKLWLQQAPPVVESKGFDPSAEARIFEAHEGFFIVDPNSGKKYRKGRFLGKGGFANCHEFTDVSTNAVYAGKIICKSHFQKPKEKGKMMLEIKLHKKLSHENVVSFHGHFEDRDNLYLILELCSRKSLDELLKQRGSLTEPEVRYYMRQVVEGCKYIHSQRIIHRDLKLGNLLLNGSMQIKIADFGLATKVSPQDDVRKMSICGTPNYVAPEVIRRRFYSFEVDVWSMGCIMYTLLCGVTPFETTTLKATYNRISTATYTLPAYLSAPARDLIVRLLDLDPINRLSLDQVLYENFFTTGFAPAHLSPSTCFRRPQFPKSNYLSRAQSMNTTSKTKQQTTTNRQLLTIRKFSTTQTIANSSHNDLTSITSISGTDDISMTSSPGSRENPLFMKRIPNTIDLYKILARCMGSLHKDTGLELELPDSSILYVTRWVDFSNKYGFGFQLSDDSTGVLFSDTTRMTLHRNSTTLKFVDWSNAVSTWHLPAEDEMNDDSRSKLSVLLYVKSYMYNKLKPTKLDSSQSSTSTNFDSESTIGSSSYVTTFSANSLSVRSSYSSRNSQTEAVDNKYHPRHASPESSGFTIANNDEDTSRGSADSSPNTSSIIPVFTIVSFPEKRSSKRVSKLLETKKVPSLSSPSPSLLRKSVSQKKNCREERVEFDTTTCPKPAKRISLTSMPLRFPTASKTKNKLSIKKQDQYSASPASSATSSSMKRLLATVASPASSIPDVSSLDQSISSLSTLENSSNSVAATQASDGVSVIKWFREDDGIIMHLSNGTYQVNFTGDHTKIVLSLHNDEYIVTYIPNTITRTIPKNPPRKTKNKKTDLITKDGYRNSKECNYGIITSVKPSHYFLLEICEKGCSLMLADKLKTVRKKIYKLINFEGQTV